MVLPVAGQSGDRVFAARSTNLSAGGACLEVDGEAPEVGKSMLLRFAVPGTGRHIDVDAEVRWAEPGKTTRCGVMFRNGHRRLLAALVAGVVGVISGNAEAANRTAVPTFDPNGDVELDMDAGGERPDQQRVLEALSRQYDEIDACVVDAKSSPRKTMGGEAHVSVLLNPQGETPLGINADLPKPVAKDRELRECLRAAVATAPYPSYDGPPIVVEFDFELDPGFEEVPGE